MELNMMIGIFGEIELPFQGEWQLRLYPQGVALG